ncbi:MAG: DUF2782 domain-containing protein [Methylophilaceae bacterium]
MRNHPFYLVGLLAMLALPFSALAADAQSHQPTPTPADAVPLEDLPPPALGNEENPDEPQITIKKKKGETIEEYRVHGQLYMMKITPAHGVPYYLHKEDQDGAWVNDGPNPPNVIPKWIIFRF